MLWPFVPVGIRVVVKRLVIGSPVCKCRRLSELRRPVLMSLGLGLFLLASKLLPQDLNKPSSWESLVQAERDFAKASQETTMRDAFLAFLAEDAILFRPYPVSGKQWIREHPSPADLLIWTPSFADLSQSGDMGYTLGPWEIRDRSSGRPLNCGHFMSIWKVQSDSSWKVALDLGIGHPCPVSWPTRVQSLPESRPSKRDQSKINVKEELSELRASEKALQTGINGKGAAQTYLQWVTEATNVYRPKHLPVSGKQEIFSFMSQRTGPSTFRIDRMELSSGADLGYVFGIVDRVSSSGTSKQDSSVYLRVWKKTAGRWKIAVDVELPPNESKT